MTNSNLSLIILSKPRELTVLECLWSMTDPQSLVHSSRRDNVRLLFRGFLCRSTIGYSCPRLNRIHLLVLLSQSVSYQFKLLLCRHLLHFLYCFFSLAH